MDADSQKLLVLFEYDSGCLLAFQTIFMHCCDFRANADVDRGSQQHDAVASVQQREFADLDRTLQDFITRLAQGFTNFNDLVTLEHRSTRDFIQSQIAGTKDIVGQEGSDIRLMIGTEHLETRNLVNSKHHDSTTTILTTLQNLQYQSTVHEDHQELLRSLYYPEIEARQESILLMR